MLVEGGTLDVVRVQFVLVCPHDQHRDSAASSSEKYLSSYKKRVGYLKCVFDRCPGLSSFIAAVRNPKSLEPQSYTIGL
jgi:hypothetical protein